MPRSVSFRALIQNFRRATPPLSYTESPPPGLPLGGILVFEETGKTGVHGEKPLRAKYGVNARTGLFEAGLK